MAIEDPEDFKQQAGLCIINSYLEHQEEAAKEFAIAELNQETGKIIGERIGVTMLNHCPEMLLRMGKSVNKELVAKSEFSLKGKIDSIEQGDFITFKLKDSEGKVHKLLWYQHFIGSDGFTSDPKKLVGKKVLVKVKEVECYAPKAKAYFKLKEIVELVIE